MSTLVIVESPAKAKTIKKYLGPGYEVVASMGHVRDLPAAKLSVDVKNGFTPKYALQAAIRSFSQPTPTARERLYPGTCQRCSTLISMTKTESPSTR